MLPKATRAVPYIYHPGCVHDIDAIIEASVPHHVKGSWRAETIQQLREFYVEANKTHFPKLREVFQAWVALGHDPKEFRKPMALMNHDRVKFYSEDPEAADILRNKNLMLLITQMVRSKDITKPDLEKLIVTPYRWQLATTVSGIHNVLSRSSDAEDYAFAIGPGGFHHKKSGFCPISDIKIAANLVRKRLGDDAEILYVDFDANLGDGPIIDFQDDPRVTILDIHSTNIFPFRLADWSKDPKLKWFLRLQFGMKNTNYMLNKPNEAAAIVKAAQELGKNHLYSLSDESISEELYLDTVRQGLEALQADVDAKTKDSKKPKIILFNIGCDTYALDRQGNFNVSKEAVSRAHLMVFEFGQRNGIPVYGMTSGGYHPDASEIIFNTIKQAALLENDPQGQNSYGVTADMHFSRS